MTREPLENETGPDLGAHTFNAGTWESKQTAPISMPAWST